MKGESTPRLLSTTNVVNFYAKEQVYPAASLSLPSLTCGPKSSDSPSTFSRLRPFFHGGCPGGEDDGGGGEGDERGVAAREHHRRSPGGAAPVTPHARTGMRGRREGMTTREEQQGHFCPFDRLSFFFAVYFNQYQRCYIIGVDGGFV